MTYRFGPEGDMDIAFSPSFEASAGMPYESCKDGAKLVFQLLCHAVAQIQETEKDGWSLLKIEEVSNWEYPNAKAVGAAVILGAPRLITRPLPFVKYQIRTGEKAVFVVREGSAKDFLIEYFEPENDWWIEKVLDCAMSSCRLFGRR